MVAVMSDEFFKSDPPLLQDETAKNRVRKHSWFFKEKAFISKHETLILALRQVRAKV